MEMEKEESLESLISELRWWEKYLTEAPKNYKDDPERLKKNTERAKQQIARLKKLISDRRNGRGDREQKEYESYRRKKARGTVIKKKK